MAKKNYFEQLLAKITDSEAKTQLQELVGKVPELNEWVYDPETINTASAMSDWAQREWDYEHGMPKNEWKQLQTIREMEATYTVTATKLQELQAAGVNNVDLNELNQRLDAFMGEKKLLTADALAAKEQQVNDLVNNMSRLATRIPYLNAQNKDEFGNYFDPDDFLAKATEAGAKDLDKYWKDTYTQEARSKKAEQEIERRVTDARRDERLKVLQEQSGSQMPTLDGSPEIGHFQAKIMGLKDPNAPALIAPEAELGKGQIARAAAQAGDLAAAQGRVQ